MQPHIGITEKNLKSVTSTLSTVLADAVVLYTRTRKFHWNVSGESFMELHLLFEKQYNELEEAIDGIATADFPTGLMEDHETNAWKLRRYFA